MSQNRVVKYSPSGLVLRAFHESKAFVRAIMGPVGSGKSTACVAEIIRRASLQEPSPDGIRKTRWAIIRNCYDAKTEILTEQGWKFFKDLQSGVKVAQLNNDVMEFVEPLSYYRAPYHGEMMGFEGEGVDFLVTPNHKLSVSKMFSRKKIWQPYGLRLAKDIFGTTGYRVKRDAQWIGIAPKFSVDVFEWLGFFFAEGHIGIGPEGRRRFNITQCKPKGIVYAKDLFSRAGIAYAQASKPEGGSSFRISINRQGDGLENELYDLLKGIGVSTTLGVPSWIKNSPKPYLEAFIKGFIEGDGNRGVSTVAFTSSKQLADDLQEMALRCGQVVNLASRDRRGKEIIYNGVRIVTRAIEWTATFVGEAKYNPRLFKQQGRYRGWYKEQYGGDVYCLEVPTHLVYVRRNGRAFWCSQSYPELRTTTLKTWAEWCPLSFGKVNMDSPFMHHVKTSEMDLEIFFLALDRPEDSRKLLSLELTGAWVNEAREVPKAIIDVLTSRVGRFPSKLQGGATWSGVLLDTNPPDTTSWWYRLAEEETPEGWTFFKQPSGRDPLLAENVPNLPDKYYDRLVQGKDPDWIKVYADGDYGFLVEGKPVFPQYRDSFHCATAPIPLDEHFGLLLAADFGLTPACIIAQKLPDGRWHVVDELTTDNTGIKRFAELLVSYIAINYPDYNVLSCWGDPSGAYGAETEEETALGIMNAVTKWKWRPAPGDNSIHERLECVRNVLNRNVDGHPGILISPKCKQLRKGFANGYHYQLVSSGNGQVNHEVPKKNEYSHIHDALQYLLLGGGEFDLILNRMPDRKKNRPRFAKGFDKGPFDV